VRVQVNKVGVKVRGALITEIYRKALSANATTLSQFSTGQVVLPWDTMYIHMYLYLYIDTCSIVDCKCDIHVYMYTYIYM